MVAISFLTKIVVLLEVSSEEVNIRVEILFAVTLAEMAPEMLLPQVRVEGIFVEVALITELAARVTFVRRVIGVTCPPVSGQSLACVHLKLPWKQL